MLRSPEDIARLFSYNRWANAQTLESVSGLTFDEYTRKIGGSFGSIRGTLAHLYGADWVWLERWHGRSPRALPDAQEVPTLEALKLKWAEVERGRTAVLDRLTAERLAESLTYVNFQGQTWTYRMDDLLVHVANHATYHRGQVATLVRQLGKVPIATDYLRFIDAEG